MGCWPLVCFAAISRVDIPIHGEMISLFFSHKILASDKASGLGRVEVGVRGDIPDPRALGTGPREGKGMRVLGPLI